MKRLLLSLLLIFLLFKSWPFIDKQIENTSFYPVIENIKAELNTMKNNQYVQIVTNTISEAYYQLTGKLKNIEFLSNDNDQTNQTNKPQLTIPTEHAFSIHNVVLGEKKGAVEQKLGVEKRSSMNEYGTNWHTYHDNYQNFLMVAYDENNEVSGLFTNQDLIASTKGVKFGTPKETVLQQLGEPLKQIRKGMKFFVLQDDRDYDIFHIDGSYLTIFYDKHNKNHVTSLLIMNEELEQNKKDLYTKASGSLKEGFEYQLFDLTNAERVNHHLQVLKWDEHVKETARNHSKDMAVNNYFSHTNLNGQSPFDRMGKDEIIFTLAGENLATGQFSSIFAHEGLMNSLGHRENILRPEFQFLGVGVAFNSEAQPYYTENFFAK
ncbi:CAP domain-containing protein [Bacillus sp. Bva_UNVM-123]|uniref:CAP domain-containing protein n=1 Tax=Bacillus sp. Bva_UNVM-123 TaxID=2829798 RepID=UPI00391F134E